MLLSGCEQIRWARNWTKPEQTSIYHRSPEDLATVPIDEHLASDPRTVSFPETSSEPLQLSLDEAIQMALNNAEVIRVLGGFSASSTGSTIYDVAISNTGIDTERARFDPNFTLNNTFSQNETPFPVVSPGPNGARIVGTDTDSYVLDGSLAKTNTLGGTATVRLGVNRSDIEPGMPLLNPQTSHFTELSYVQPLLRGAGQEANVAPILIARTETERSFFQFKGNTQQLVRSVIEGYWSLVSARTDRWAREQQVEQAEFAYDRELKKKERGLGDLGDVSQTRVALANFKASLVASKSAVLQREAALLNVLGLSPTEVGEVIPVTPPHEARIQYNWGELISMAQTYRPDLVELKLIIEADEQRALIAENNAKPQLDAVALYRWDGLRGRTPGGPTVATNADDFTDWTMGVNFSVPLGLRQSRAAVRQRELVVMRDHANLRQGVHSAVHQVALSIRTQDQLYEQYEAFLETRIAAEDNLLVQQAEFANGRTIFLNVLQAITDWGNAVSSEAQSLTQYNTELANLELQSGTILESHGVRFMEERFEFAGPCHLFEDVCYPAIVAPTENSPRYEAGDEPSEESFDLTNPLDEAKLKKKNDPKKILPPKLDGASLPGLSPLTATGGWNSDPWSNAGQPELTLFDEYKLKFGDAGTTSIADGVNKVDRVPASVLSVPGESRPFPIPPAPQTEAQPTNATSQVRPVRSIHSRIESPAPSPTSQQSQWRTTRDRVPAQPVSFVTQGVDRIELTRAARWVEAEEDPHSGRE